MTQEKREEKKMKENKNEKEQKNENRRKGKDGEDKRKNTVRRKRMKNVFFFHMQNPVSFVLPTSNTNLKYLIFSLSVACLSVSKFSLYVTYTLIKVLEVAESLVITYQQACKRENLTRI
jgi:hypothetical protein